MTRFAALAVVVLTGCSTPVPEVVKVPIPVSCVPTVVPDRPRMTSNAELRAMDDRQLLLTIAAERLEQGAYSAEAEALMEACR